MKDLKFLEEYINGVSPTGYEILLGGQQIWIDYVKKFANRVDVDMYGNAYAYYGDMDSNFTVLLDAHADEIGFLVSDITSDGFIKVNRLGGSDIKITPASKVNIWTDNGPVKGVFGHPAIHVQKEYKLSLEKLFIDVGVDSKEKVEKLGIEVGTPITMDSKFEKIGNYYTGKSLDDKVGGYVNAMVLKELSSNNINLSFKLVIVNSVQEEVGLFGAKMALNKIKPNIAIAFDVTHCTKSPAYDSNRLGSTAAGKGIVITNAPSIQKNLFKLLKETAKSKKISYQLETSGRGTGTNTDSYAYPLGVPSALVSIPMRYMHTTSEYVHKKDVKAAIKLLYSVLTSDKITSSLSYV